MASYDSIMGQQVALSRKLAPKDDVPPPWEGAAPGATFNVPASSVPPEVASAYTTNPDGTVTLPAGVMPAYKGGGTVTPGPTAPVQTDTEMPDQGGAGPMAVPTRTQPQQYTAGGMMRTGETTQKGFDIGAANRANLDMGHDRQMQAVRDAAVQGQAKAVEQAEYSKAMADQQEQYAVEKKARDYDHDQKTEAAMAPMRALSEELATGKVDPSRYLQNQSTGAKLATMLSVIMGAGAAQRINGRNVGLDMMNDAIARDIDAQKASFDMKRGALAAKQSLYGQMLQNFGREDLAKEAAHLAIMKGYEAKIGAIAAKYAGTETAAKMEATLGQMQEANAEREIKLLDATRDHVVTQDTYRAPQAIGGTSSGIQELPASKLVDLPDGRSVVVGREEDASKLRSKIGASEEIIRNLSEIKRLRAGMSALAPIDSARAMADINALTESTKQIITVHREQGAMSQGDATVATGGLGLRNIMTNPGAMDTAIKELRSGIENNVKASGGAYVNHGFATDAKGVQHRTMQYTGETTNRPKQAAAPVAVKPVT